MKSLLASVWTGIACAGRRGMRRRVAAVALVACAGLVAACGSSSSAAGSSAHTPVKVGYLLPLTGVFTRNGTGWNFAQVPQMVLAGDSASPIA